MPSRFEQRFHSYAVTNLQREFGVTVTFTRGGDSSDGFTARRNIREYESIGNEYGTEISVVLRDYILPAASVVIDSVTIEPRTGDQITEGDEVFEIVASGGGSPAVELQTGGYEWLVHTMRVTA